MALIWTKLTTHYLKSLENKHELFQNFSVQRSCWKWGNNMGNNMADGTWAARSNDWRWGPINEQHQSIHLAIAAGKKGRVLGCWCCCWCRCAVAVDMSPVGLYNRWGIATHCCFCRLNNTTIKTQQQPNHLSQPVDQQRNSPDFTARQHGQ